MGRRKYTRRTPEQLRRDALRLFKLINDERIPEDIRWSLGEYTDDLTTDAPSHDIWRNRPHFVRCFVEAWQLKGWRAEWSREKVGGILDRLDKGESIESIIADYTGWKRRPVKPVKPELTPEQKARGELARLISEVIQHPALPADLRASFYEALNEFQNTVDLDQLCYSEAALAHGLELRAEDEAARKDAA